MYNTIYIGDKIVLDLKNDTVRPETLGRGITAYDADGHLITGTALFIGDMVSIYMEINTTTYNFEFGLTWDEFCTLYGDDGWEIRIPEGEEGMIGDDVLCFNRYPVMAYDENGNEKGYIKNIDLVNPDWTYYA